MRGAVALLLIGTSSCGGGPDTRLDYHRQDTFERGMVLSATVEDACERRCSGATDHQKDRCGDTTCDTHEHRKGEWSLQDAELQGRVRETVETLSSTFFADMKPELAEEFKDDADRVAAEVRRKILEETRKRFGAVSEEIRAKCLQSLAETPRISEAWCNTSSVIAWKAQSEARVAYSYGLRLSGGPGNLTIVPEFRVSVKVRSTLGTPEERVSKKSDCPCAGKP